MPITRPAPERTRQVFAWTVNELENQKGYEFITPQGYVFGVSTKVDALQLVCDVSWSGHVHSTMYGDVHNINGGVIEAWSPDPWINSGWKHLDPICRSSHLIDTIMHYAMEEWIN
jgi:hypothetical protein